MENPRKKRFWENKDEDKDITSDTYIDTPKLETEDETKTRIRSLWVINIQTLIFALSFSIVITGVLPYLRQVTLLI